MTLSQLLFKYGFSAITLSARLNIPIDQLEEMYERSALTDEEAERIAEALEETPKTVQQLFNVQAGNFNQNGTANKQKVSNRKTVYKFENCNVLIQVVPAAAPKPKSRSRKPKALEQNLPHWQADHLLPGSQADPFRSLTSGTHGF